MMNSLFRELAEGASQSGTIMNSPFKLHVSTDFLEFIRSLVEYIIKIQVIHAVFRVKDE